VQYAQRIHITIRYSVPEGLIVHRQARLISAQKYEKRVNSGMTFDSFGVSESKRKAPSSFRTKGLSQK
jgi:hypothetical protein